VGLPDEPDGLEPVEPPPFCPHEGITVRKDNNPAIKEQAMKSFEERFIGRLTGGEIDAIPAYAPGQT
jgi:hypothetical protein